MSVIQEFFDGRVPNYENLTGKRNYRTIEFWDGSPCFGAFEPAAEAIMAYLTPKLVVQQKEPRKRVWDSFNISNVNYQEREIANIEVYNPKPGYNPQSLCAPYFQSIFAMENRDFHHTVNASNIVFGHGTEHLYCNALHACRYGNILGQGENILNEGDFVLTAVPTYGDWALKPEDIGARAVGVGVREVMPGNYRMTAEDLDRRITELNEASRAEHLHNAQSTEAPRVKLFVMINPNNPLGTVYTKKEVEAFAAVLKKHDVWVIDDQVYRGMEYSDEKFPNAFTLVPHPFASVEGMYDKTLTLIGLSKAYGLPGIRSGVACGPENWAKSLEKTIRKHGPVYNQEPSVIATVATFSGEVEKKRKDFLVKNASAYRLKRALLTALVDGVDSFPKIEFGTYAERYGISDRIKFLLSGEREFKSWIELKKSKNPKADLLLKGLPYLKTLGTPESGFFQLIDATAVKGLYTDENVQINTSSDLVEYLYKKVNIAFVAGDRFGWPSSDGEMNDGKLILRCSYSMRDEDMIEGIKRLHMALEMLRECPVQQKADKKVASR